jgi:hypothetical protein
LFTILTNDETFHKDNVLNGEDKSYLIQIILDECKDLIKRLVSKSAKKVADNYSSAQNQSKERRARSAVLFNLMTGSQILPARPRDFRANFPEDLQDIRKSQLSDVLSSPVRMNLTDNKRDNFPFKRGRPTEVKQSLAEERRGRLSHFTESKFHQTVDRLLEHPSDFEEIKTKLREMDEYYKILVYSFEMNQLQFLTNKEAFMKSQKPAIMKYGIRDISNIKNMASDQIHSWAEEQAKKEMANPSKDGIKILIKTAATLAYHREKLASGFN